MKKTDIVASTLAKILFLISSLLLIQGCAQLSNPKYSQPGSSRWDKYLEPPVLTPSESTRRVSINTLGTSFKYTDSNNGSTSSPKLSADQLSQKLSGLGHSLGYRLNISNATANQKFKIEQQREGILVFHCEGECSNVVINVKGDFAAGLGMQSHFPAIWFRSPTLYRHIVYLRIVNPQEVANQRFNIQVTLWDAV